MDGDIMTQVAGDSDTGLYEINGQTHDASGQLLDPNVKNYISVNGEFVKPEWAAPPRPDVVREVPVESPMAAMAGTDQFATVLSAMQTLEDMVEKLSRTIGKQNQTIQTLLDRVVGVEQTQLRVAAPVVAAPPGATEVPSAFPLGVPDGNPYVPQTEVEMIPVRFADGTTKHFTREQYDALSRNSPTIPSAEEAETVANSARHAQTVPASQVTPGKTLEDRPPADPAQREEGDNSPPDRPRDPDRAPPPSQLSNRAQIAIENNGCTSLSDVMSYDRESVSEWPGVGPAILAEIELKIKESGGFFRM